MGLIAWWRRRKRRKALEQLQHSIAFLEMCCEGHWKGCSCMYCTGLKKLREWEELPEFKE